MLNINNFTVNPICLCCKLWTNFHLVSDFWFHNFCHFVFAKILYFRQTARKNIIGLGYWQNIHKLSPIRMLAILLNQLLWRIQTASVGRNASKKLLLNYCPNGQEDYCLGSELKVANPYIQAFGSTNPEGHSCKSRKMTIF